MQCVDTVNFFSLNAVNIILSMNTLIFSPQNFANYWRIFNSCRCDGFSTCPWAAKADIHMRLHCHPNCTLIPSAAFSCTLFRFRLKISICNIPFHALRWTWLLRGKQLNSYCSVRLKFKESEEQIKSRQFLTKRQFLTLLWSLDV